MADKKKSAKATTLVVAIVFTVSVSGYFVGLRQTVHEADATPQTVELFETHEEAHPYIQKAVDYNQIAEAGFGPNALFKSHLSSLKHQPEETAHPVPYHAPAEAVRVKRNARRAYDGAPPIVPHPIAQDSAASCLQCHTQATQIGDVIAPAISHPAYTSCTQCHVSGKGLGSRWNTAPLDLHTGNQFEGNHESLPAQRAYADAPPTIPHQLHMRQNCMSCHGPLGNSPIRTTHPERQSCTQCHVPGSRVDKRNFAESPFPFVEALNQSD